MGDVVKTVSFGVQLQCEPPPEHSILGSSLERGSFTKAFSHWHVLGEGAFGKVLKAWHIEDKRWYAVKLIHTRLRATETVDDEACREWSGLEVFNILCQARNSHLLRYFRRWTELPDDLPADSIPDSAALRLSPQSGPAEPKTDHLSQYRLQDLDVSERRDVGWRSAREKSKFTYGRTRTLASSCGFEFISDDDTKDASSNNATEVPTPPSNLGKSKRYDVILAVQLEFCDGVTLDRWLTNPQLRRGLVGNNSHIAVELFKQLVEALAEIHAHGIVHSDVKPGNILVSASNGRLKLFDFGLAHMESNSSVEAIRKRRHSWAPPADAPEAHTAVGTPGYAAPELCRPTGDACERGSAEQSQSMLPSATRSADIFSAGVVLVELLQATTSRGQAWSTRMERAKTLRSFQEGAAELPTMLRQAVPTWLRQLVMRMLAFDPDARPTAVEVLSEITQGLRLRDQHNPYLGTFDWSKHAHSSAQHNPYVGFFVDHRPGLRSS
eukprot:TRINITY_DN30098_c0_g1_i1.p1 TRINITY_DN30098_c0_g1~~TRINITY_DN30098_c0_g1_i1.p1  ORF type:complete len:496 (-),score=31.37 TRINITY_DN30098_c0_g1_i1:230-1717(-)